MDFFKRFFKKVDAKLIAPGGGAMLEHYDDPDWPVLPKEVVQAAIGGGWPFFGSLGPEHLLDLRLFDVIARQKKEWPNRSGVAFLGVNYERGAKWLAHEAYDFYLDNMIKPVATKEERMALQQAAREMWLELIK